jgi:hypothetical protein
MSTIRAKVINELRELIPVTVFFFIAFQLLAFTKALILLHYGIRVNTFVNATIAAMIVAKVVLIADHFRFVNRYPTKPLIYNVLWKTAIYLIASVIVRYVEHLIHFWRESPSIAEANRRLWSEVVWPHFWAVQIWLLLVLLMYCAFRELTRALGRERIIRMFFHEPVAPNLAA